ncbi:hypothetical protein CMUS01_01132 [Colletotrichum musicola]|uniref:Uncharacterized protein n=1 Tax=Colletotrichum musicola TaxID=2175873 RepID=A0A8H6NXI4_9PEZI|nr:hypothetical protein CMUS01_01132 [Colletotrichum musicola]
MMADINNPANTSEPLLQKLGESRTKAGATETAKDSQAESDDPRKEHGNARADSASKQTKTRFEEIFQNTLRSLGLHPVYRLVFEPLTGQDKTVIFKNRLVALLAATLHAPALVGAAVLTQFVFKEHFIGARLSSGGKWDSQVTLAIQFAAKFLETLILASLSTMMFTFIRHEITKGRGLPLAAFFAPTDFRSLSFVWSDEFLALLTSRFSSVWKKVAFLALSVLCCLLAAVVAPSAATILLPANDWYTIGGTRVFLDTPHEDVFPLNITASHTLNGSVCEVAGNHRCPSSGWETLQHLAAYFPSHTVIDFDNWAIRRPPTLFTVPMPGSLPQMSLRIREPFENNTDSSIGFDASASRVMLPHHATGAALAETATIWANAIKISERKDRNWIRGSDQRVRSAHYVAALQTRCQVSFFDPNRTSSNAVVFPDVRLEDTVDQNTTIEHPRIARFVQNLDGSVSELLFLDADATGELARNVSVGAVVAVPIAGGNSLALYGCLTSALWTPRKLKVAGDHRIGFDYQDPSPHEWLSGRDESGNRKVVIHTSLANLTNPPVDAVANATVFQRLVDAAEISNTAARRLDWTVGHVETIINAMLANGMSRVAPDAKPILQLRDENGTWWRNFFRHRPEAGRRMTYTVFAVPEADRDRLAGLDFAGDVFAYYYTYKDPAVRYSLIGLLAYCVLAVAFVSWSLATGVTGTSWESTPELLALAMRSPAPGDDVMPTSVVEELGPLRRRYCVVVGEGRGLQLRPVNEVDSEKTVRANEGYH